MGARLARLTDALLDVAISKEVFDARNAGLLAERRGLQDQLAGLGGEPIWLKHYREFELNNPQLLRHGTLLDAEKRDLVIALCSDLGVEGKKPVIALRSPYKEIAAVHGLSSGGPRRVDVRTTGQIDSLSTTPTNHRESRARARQIFEILLSSATADANENTKTNNAAAA